GRLCVRSGPPGASLREFGNFISADLLRWILIVSFIAMGIWILIPDKIDEGGNDDRLRRFGVFGTTVILFFIAEVGDKTQVATVALAARYPAEAFWVVCGTTLGLMIADAPAVFIGNKLAEKISMKLMRQIAAAVFFILAVVAYLEA
ncbi:TMEM165/GDT1 family protein, partial [Sutterella wadsworthensis]|uniref:TMEM165/GDT1 family protein n=1 Tax=Sutterella wadsworthensis TaxID=40545 RepID=UPI002675E6A1